MVRSFLLALSAASLFLVLGIAQSAFAEEEPDITNIGFVLYTKSYAPGTLNARWMFTDKDKGPGIATGGPEKGYAGKYRVRYFYDSGEYSDE